MQSISACSHKPKLSDFQLKSADVSRTQEVGHVIHICFGCS